MRALASHNVRAAPDLCTCTAAELEAMDVRSLLSHHAIPACGKGSFTCVSAYMLDARALIRHVPPRRLHLFWVVN